MPNCRECLHDEMCFSTHTGDSPACCDFLDAARYHEIMQAEREGRLVILPCKIGDEFWTEYCNKVQKVKVSMITQKADKTWKVRFSVLNGWGSSINGSFNDIGKTVFLTRSEAEKALEGANG